MYRVCWDTMRSRMASVSGPIDQPSPITWVVTPWVSSDIPRLSMSRLEYEWLNMFTKPGATASPVASSTVPDSSASPALGPISTMRSPATHTLAATPSEPEPS